MTRADFIAAALLLAALTVGFHTAIQRLAASEAYAACLGDQRPPIPQVMPDTMLASTGQLRFLSMSGTNNARKPVAEAGQDVGSTPTASTIYGGVPDSTGGRSDGSCRMARPQQGKLHNRQPGGNAPGGLAVSAVEVAAFLRASTLGAKPSTVMPDGAIRKDAQAGGIGTTAHAGVAEVPYALRTSGTKPCHAGRSQSLAIPASKPSGALVNKECP